MEFFKTLQETFEPAKFIDQAEKNTQAVLAYVEPKELNKTLVSLTSATTNLARAQLEAINSITAIVKAQGEEFTKSLTKAPVKLCPFIEFPSTSYNVNLHNIVLLESKPSKSIIGFHVTLLLPGITLEP